MARSTFSDDALALKDPGLSGGAVRSAHGTTVTIYTDAAGTVLANIQTIAGAAIPGSVLTISGLRLPAFLGPDGATALYAKPAGASTTTAIYAMPDVATTVRTAALRGTAHTLALVRKLRAGVDGAFVTILGDSTANESSEWFQTAMVALAARFPTYNLTTRLWNDTTQAYDAPSTLQTGVGGERNLYATASNGAYLSTPDSANLSITGDLEVHVKAACDTWTAQSVVFELCGKSAAAPQVGWFLRLNTTGTLTFFWSNDGTAVLSSTSTVAVPFAAGAVGWIRVSIDVDNAAAGRDVKFYTGTDGAAWTQLGTTVTSAGVTSIFDNTARLQLISREAIGGMPVSTPGMAAYEMRLYNGLGTTLRANPQVEYLAHPNAVFADVQGNMWTAASGAVGNAGHLRGAPTLALYNGSTPGQTISYSNDGTRFPKQTPQTEMDLAFINYGHNEGTTSAVRAAWKQLADALIAKSPDVGVVVAMQNPQYSPRTAQQISAHTSRFAVLRLLASSQRYGIVDAHEAFSRDDPTGATYVNVDGVHPTVAGSNRWAAEAGYLFDSTP